MVGWMDVGWSVGRLVGWMDVGWSVGWLDGWLDGWLVSCLTSCLLSCSWWYNWLIPALVAAIVTLVYRMYTSDEEWHHQTCSCDVINRPASGSFDWQQNRRVAGCWISNCTLPLVSLHYNTQHSFHAVNQSHGIMLMKSFMSLKYQCFYKILMICNLVETQWMYNLFVSFYIFVTEC